MRGALFPRVGRPFKPVDLEDVNCEGSAINYIGQPFWIGFPNMYAMP